MELIENLKKKIEPILQEPNILLYELRWLNGSDKVLQVSIMYPDGTMDLDTCATISEKISELLDEDDSIQDAYTLEVCSPGAEREIIDHSQIAHLTDPYVFVRLAHSINKKNEFTGEITCLEDGSYQLVYREKAVKKTIQFMDEEITYIRMAVRI